MMDFNAITKILEHTDCHIADGSRRISRLCIDSRKVDRPAETLFFALKTARNDGHRYIPDLIEAGVRNFVVSTLPAALDQNCNFLVVPSPLATLQALARHHRAQFHYPVIGITGSNGKTIVKEWLATMLQDSFHLVKSPDSYNSQLGVPLSVWRMSEDHDLAIFEAGISRPDEMQHLAEIIRPTIGILTNIGMAHAQFFMNQNQKALEKLKLFQHADKLIYHDDNIELNTLLTLPEYDSLEKISWGSPNAAYPVLYQVVGNKTLATIQGHGYPIPFIDAASIENATHAIITMLVLGIPPEVIDQRLVHLTHINMRLEILQGRNHTVIINDTYSLDRNALNAALDFLDTQRQLPKKTVILSDFEQVGTLSDADYDDLNRQLKRHDVQRLLGVGEGFVAHRERFDLPECLFYADTDKLLELLPDFAYETILVKGARSFHFERVVAKLQHKTHLTILNVSLPALAHNLAIHRALLKPQTKMVAMVKAQSYGLGDVELVNELIHQHIDYLAVAYTDEGVRLRKRHIQTPIIVLGAEAHSFDVMVQHNLEPEIFNFYYLQELEKVLRRHPNIQQFNIHIKLDTGMHRLGFDEQDLPKLIAMVKANPQLHIASVFSHLAAAEDPHEDEYTRKQIALFTRMTDQLCGAFDHKILRHILNSAGIYRFTESQFDMVRLGISLYGCSEIPEVAAKLHNVATLKTVVTQVKRIAAGETIGYNRSYRLKRDSQVAIIPIGYADGYPRELANGKGTVLIQGQKVPIIGKICMDMCMLDVTGLSVHEGDEVTVYGEGNTVADMAEAAGLISYELLTRISKRVPRVYVKE